MTIILHRLKTDHFVMKIRPLLFASLLTATLSGMAFAGGPYGSIRVGNWIGGAYTNDVTGAFSHCAAIASYQGGINFAVGLGANNEWSLGFSHPSWTLVPGETIPITLTFDGRGPFNVFGIAQSPQIVIVAMPRNSVLMTEFRRSYVMTAFAKGSAFSFALTSTSQLMPILSNCVDRMNRGLAPGNFAIAAPGYSPPPTGAVTAPGSFQPEPEENYRIEAIEIATNFILNSGLQNPRLLRDASESSIPVTANGVVWKSEEGYGFVRIVPEQGETKGIDIASAIAAADAKECKGKFATGREAELIDSEVIFRGFSACEDTDGARSAQYFVLPRKKGGFVVFSLVSEMQTGQAHKVLNDEKLLEIRKAALVAVAQ